MLFSRTLTALLAAGCLSVAAPCARAADEPGPEDPRAKLKAQVEKILKLMRENEAALLEASTAGGATPKGPDVKVPDPPPGQSGTPPPSGQDGAPPPSGEGTGTPPSGSGSGGNAGARGEEIRKRIEEIIKGQQATAGKIPEELAELVRMVPKGSGPGSPSGVEPPKESGEGPESPEARDARKRKELEEQQRQEKGGKDPKDAQDKRDPGENGGRPPSESDLAPQNPRDPKEKPWQTMLPPEMRNSEAGGGLENLPGRLGQIIRDYLYSLHRQRSQGTTPR